MEDNFQNLEYIGMFCLGTFVAGIMNYGLSSINNSDTFLKVSASILGGTFGGVVFIFLQWILGQKNNVILFRSAFMYPVGLILSLLWLQMNSTIENLIISTERKKQIIGWSHFIGLSILTFFIVFQLLFGPKIN
jgi:hypothetical protein